MSFDTVSTVFYQCSSMLVYSNYVPLLCAVNFKDISLFSWCLWCPRTASQCMNGQPYSYNNYSSPSLIGSLHPPNTQCNSVLIRGVLWWEGGLKAFIALSAKKFCPYYRGVLWRECPGTIVFQNLLRIKFFNICYIHCAHSNAAVQKWTEEICLNRLNHVFINV